MSNPPLPICSFNPSANGLERWFGPLESATDLLKPGHQISKPRRGKELPSLKLSHRGPVLDRGQQQGLVLIRDGFVG